MPKKLTKAENFNWYERIPKEYLTKTHNPHYNIHHIQLPFRAIIVGNSGSMKTNTLLNLIFNMPDTFSRIVICTKNKDEPFYNYLEEHLPGVEIYEGIDALPDLDSFNKEENSLVVCDDLVLEKNQKGVEQYAIRCRKLGASLVYITQDYYKVPKTIRYNSTYLFIKKLASLRDLQRILNEFSLGIDKKVFNDMYKHCTQKLNDFLLVDIQPKEEELKFRKNFDECLLVKE